MKFSASYLRATINCAGLIALLTLQSAGAQDLLWQTLFDSGAAAAKKGDYPVAERQLAGALKDAEAIGGKDNRLQLTLRALVPVEIALDNFAKAEEYLKRLLDASAKGGNKISQQIDVAADTAQLGQIYTRMGRYAEAQPLFFTASGMFDKLLAANKDAANTDKIRALHREALDNWAALYESEGKFSEAEALLKRTLVFSEDVSPKDAIAVGSALDNLAKLHLLQGRFADAEPLLKRALTMRVQELGPVHPEVAKSLLGLGSLYQQQGKYVEAESVINRAIAVREQSGGANTAAYADAIISLAKVLREEDQLPVAQKQFEKALQIQEQVFGTSSAQVADTLSELAQTLMEQYDYAGCAPLFQRALSIHEGIYGKDSPMIARDLNALALLHLDQGQYAVSESLYKRALAIVEQKMPPDHPDVATCLNNLAFLYKNMGKLSEAEALLKRGLAIREKAFGPKDRRVAQNLVNIADVYQAQENFAIAEPLLKRALVAEMETLGADHPQVASIMNDLAEVYRRQQKLGDAESAYRQLLARDERVLGAENAAVASDLDNLAQILKSAGKGAESEQFKSRAQAMKARLPGAQFAAWNNNDPFPSAAASPPVRNKWALLVGISNFKDPRVNLQYAAKDATDFRNFLVSEAHFQPDHVKLLTDKDATRENIVATLGEKWLQKVAHPDDLVVLYVSTHGTAAKREVGDTNFIVPYEGNLDNIVLSGIPMQWLTVGLKELLHCNRLIVIMDVCHSGAVAVNEHASTIKSDIVANGARSIGFKAFPESPVSINSKLIAVAKHPTPSTFETISGKSGEKALRRVPPNLRVEQVVMGTGQIVLTSSASDQISWESKNYPNSVFTRQLIEGLRVKGEKTKLGEAYEQMRKKVEEEVLRDRASIQTPVLMSQSWGQGDVCLGVIPETQAEESAEKNRGK